VQFVKRGPKTRWMTWRALIAWPYPQVSNALSGAGAGAIAATIVCPLDVLKTRLQVGPSRYRSPRPAEGQRESLVPPYTHGSVYLWLTGGSRAKAWSLLIHAEASLSLSPCHKMSVDSRNQRLKRVGELASGFCRAHLMRWRANPARPYPQVSNPNRGDMYFSTRQAGLRIIKTEVGTDR